MLAFKIKINGIEKYIVGFEDWTTLGVDITAIKQNEHFPEDHINMTSRCSAEQIEPGKIEWARWQDHTLNVGDEISIEIIETQEATHPKKRYRSDSKVQENPYTEDEIVEFETETYQRLKAKFESK